MKARVELISDNHVMVSLGQNYARLPHRSDLELYQFVDVTVDEQNRTVHWID